MFIRHLSASVFFLLAPSLSLTAYGQAVADAPQPATEATARTDQSEEDWRRSRRKASVGDYDPIANPYSSGVGNVMITIDPIDQLPPASRRHLRRQRALTIAMMGPDGEIDQTAYVPSADASSDPALAASEQAAWDEMIDALQNGNQESQSADGEAGQSATSSGSGSGTTGGSAANHGSDQAAQSENLQTRDAPTPIAAGTTSSASDILSQMGSFNSSPNDTNGKASNLQK